MTDPLVWLHLSRLWSLIHEAEEPRADTPAPCSIEPAFSQHEYAVDYCETHDRPATYCPRAALNEPAFDDGD